MGMLTNLLEDDGKSGKLHMGFLLGDPASVVRIERADAKTDGLADGILGGVRVFDLGLEYLDQDLEEAALMTLLVLAEGIKVLAGNGFLAGGREKSSGPHGRLREDGLSIRRVGDRLGTLALTQGNLNPVILGRVDRGIFHDLGKRNVFHDRGKRGG